MAVTTNNPRNEMFMCSRKEHIQHEVPCRPITSQYAQDNIFAALVLARFNNSIAAKTIIGLLRLRIKPMYITWQLELEHNEFNMLLSMKKLKWIARMDR